MDVAHAFHNVPIRPSERQFMRGKVGARFIVFKVLSMGGKSSPNIWGRFAMGRVCHQSSAVTSFVARSTWMIPSWLLEVVLVKDHAPSQSHCWPSPFWVSSSLETKLVSVTVVWIGAQLSVEDSGISVAIPMDKLDALQTLTARFRSATVAQEEDLRSFYGKLPLVGGTVPTLRPFVDMVWAALASSSRQPLELVHYRRFRVALWRLQALFAKILGPLVRVFRVAASWGSEGNYIATDACP